MKLRKPVDTPMTQKKAVKIKSVTYGELADMINNWLAELVPVSGPMWMVLKGQELSQQGKADKLMEQSVNALLGGAPSPEIEAKWVAVLRTRLTFARDWFLAKHQHPLGNVKSYTEAEAAHMIRKAVTAEWQVQGLEWLLLYRSGIPVLRGCPDWKLCESARWAMTEWGEISSMGYEPGVITQDEPIYTLRKIQELVEELYNRVCLADFPSEVQAFYLDDVKSARRVEETEDFAALMCLMMKDPDMAPHSVFLLQRLAKRLAFAADYLATLEPLAPVTKREAFATIAVICTVVWATYGKGWLSQSHDPFRRSILERQEESLALSIAHREHIDVICETLESPRFLVYFR